MARADEVRLMTKIARMYYSQGIRQQDITERLNIHQSTISRLLKKARAANIVRISVAVPEGIFSELEEGLEARYNLKEVVVVDTLDDDEERSVRDLGAATAFFVETSIKPGMVVGISSWSRSLMAMMGSLHQSEIGKGGKVIQILGGVGSPATQFTATQLVRDLAARIGATPIMLQAPGIVASVQTKRILEQDPVVMEASALFGKVDVALVGIGSMTPSPLLANSGNVFSPKERRMLAASEAVGDICLRFFDRDGKPVESPLQDRVIGIELGVLKKAARVVGIAGGRSKRAAIRGALRGGWINVLITDRQTAEFLLKDRGR